MPEDGLQFERAEFDAGPAAGVACSSCRRPLVEHYWTAQGATLCERCVAVTRHDHEHGRGTSASRFLRATIFGGLAALLGTLLWWGVRRVTGYELGLIAIVVGFMVGGAVRAGSFGRGGWRYQALAMALTYVSVVSTYVPDIIEATLKPGPTVEVTEGAQPPAEQRAQTTAPANTPVTPGAALLALAFLAGLLLVAPFLGGFQNVMGWIIIGIALYEAFKLNRRLPLEVGGPFKVGSLAPAGEAAPATR